MNPPSSAKEVSFAELFPLIEEKIRGGASISFTAYGNSMLPLIHGGEDTVTLSPVENGIQKHDIVFYRRKSGSFVLHRVIRGSAEQGFTLCGDNQYYLEKGVKKEQIVAKLSALEHKGKKKDLASLSYRIYILFLPLRRFWIHCRAFLKARLG